MTKSISRLAFTAVLTSLTLVSCADKSKPDEKEPVKSPPKKDVNQAAAHTQKELPPITQPPANRTNRPYEPEGEWVELQEPFAPPTPGEIEQNRPPLGSGNGKVITPPSGQH